MYAYLSEGSPLYGGGLYRSPEDIREEITEIRRSLTECEKRMKEAEDAKEELLATIDEIHAPPEALAAIDRVVEECGELKGRFLDLWERADGLAEELADSLHLFGGKGARAYDA